MDAGLHDQLVALELDLLNPGTRGSALRLDALIADEFHEIGAGGRAFGKAEVLERLPREQGLSFEAAGFESRVVVDGVVLLTYRASRGDGAGRAESLRSSLWRREAGGWRMLFHQGTPLRAAADIDAGTGTTSTP